MWHGGQVKFISDWKSYTTPLLFMRKRWSPPSTQSESYLAAPLFGIKKSYIAPPPSISPGPNQHCWCSQSNTSESMRLSPDLGLPQGTQPCLIFTQKLSIILQKMPIGWIGVLVLVFWYMLYQILPLEGFAICYLIMSSIIAKLPLVWWQCKKYDSYYGVVSFPFFGGGGGMLIRS